METMNRLRETVPRKSQTIEFFPIRRCQPVLTQKKNRSVKWYSHPIPLIWLRMTS